MRSPARFLAYVLLLAVGASLAPEHDFRTVLAIALVGIAAMLLVQLRQTRNAVDHVLAFLALWAAASVLGAPFVAALRALVVGAAL
ncbi:hypothetical protein [Streptomyces parvulus]|uniref:hypothetical protein n=1 Tax=Streptomyces parvulus TaxID=146923 RepID=UPI003819460F